MLQLGCHDDVGPSGRLLSRGFGKPCRQASPIFFKGTLFSTWCCQYRFRRACVLSITFPCCHHSLSSMSSSSKKQPRQLQEPIPTRKLTVRESILVFKSSRLHGSTFRPWTSNVPEVELAGQTQFEDQTQFSFSELQLQQLAEWVSCSRIVDSLVGKSSCAVGERLQEENHDLAQDLTTDCSVVASLCALTSRTERGFEDLCASVFHPWDHTTEKPGISLSGKYVFRFYFNGTYRAVVIDDRLPVSKNGRRLFVSDRNNPATLWPALLEKAYLKVRGGYDFPGSNSGTDLLVMTGWVPEQIHLQR